VINEEEAKPRVSLLVTDLDNTLWDWFHAWAASFSALLDGLVDASGVERSVLEREAQTIHRLRGTTEYSWLVDELPCLQGLSGKSTPREAFDKALHLQNSARLKETSLYPGVIETLTALRNREVPVVGYTESPRFWTEWRLRTLKLDGLLEAVWSPRDHDSPKGLDPISLRRYSAENYGLAETKHENVADGAIKPSPEVLREILAPYGVAYSEVAYIGDSLHKDIAMAQVVGVIDAHAKYGESHEKPAYEQLRRVSHWTEADIEREKLSLPKVTPTPSYSLAKGFHELLEIFDFQPVGAAR
jgi:phosphoglycolate phosphatase